MHWSALYFVYLHAVKDTLSLSVTVSVVINTIKLPDKSSIIIYIIIIIIRDNNRLMPMNFSTSFADPKNVFAI